MKRYDFGVLSDDYRLLSRIQELASEFNYTFNHWKNVDELMEATDDYRLVICAMSDPNGKNNISELVRVAHQMCPSAFVICSVSGTLAKETATFAKKSGANLILLEEELLTTSKLDYACSEVIRASYLAIKATDLTPGKELGFDVFHLLPQRQKFIKFAFEGDLLPGEKLKKVQQVGEIYIIRDDAAKFSEYIKKNQDRSAAGLAKRCRAEFLALYASYANLAFLLTDQSEHASFKEGEELVKRCRILSGELVNTLASHGNAFDIVNNSTVGEFGSVERTPAIAAYAGLFALQMEMDKIDEIMIATLLSTIGLLLTPFSVSGKIRQDRLQDLTPDENLAYRRYPSASLDLALSRKLPIDPSLRELIMSVNERADGTGFPRNLPAHKIPHGSQLIRFCSLLDRRTLVKLGEQRRDPQEVLKQLAREVADDTGSISTDFCARIEKNFINRPVS
jgi:HD-GYP domain-containing protein (c-di-GMP phosphodiesterase class II)